MSDILVKILSVLFPICASLIPIPMTVKKIMKVLSNSEETQNEIEYEKKCLTRSLVGEENDDNDDDNDLESYLNDSRHKKEDTQQDKYMSTHPSRNSSKIDFNILYSPKSVTLKELHEKRNMDKSLKKISFTLAVIMSIVGTIILFSGIIISLFNNKEIGWITTSSGAIIEVVASIYFWLVNRTMKEVKDNSKQLEKTEDLFTAIDLIEKISDNSIKDEAYKNMVDNLMNREKISK